MRFATINLLMLVFALPFVAALLYWRERRKRKLLESFATPNLLNTLAKTKSVTLVLVKSTLFMAALLAAIFASARPQWGFEDRRLVSRGIDLLIAVDVSKSMLAEDYKPNRLARAKELLKNIIWSLKGDRVGIIAFAGDAAVICPLTTDYSMAHAALEGLDTSSVSAPGTDIGRAIDVAMGAFELAAQGDKVLVLLTDGEDHEGRAIEMAEKAAKAGIRIFAIGLGTTQGMPIPDEQHGGYKVDREGKVVTSKLDFSLLTRIAEITKGMAIKANPSGASDIIPILQEIEKMQQSQQQETVFRVYKERFQWFLGLALVLLVLEMFIFEMRTRREVHES
jgi:Ca-activated chloride channel family protein